MRYCSNCGTASEEGANFCANCGSSLQRNQEEVNSKDFYSPKENDDYSSTSNQQPISGGIKALLYISTVFITLIGIIVGIIYMSDPMEEKRKFGKGLLIFGIVWTIVAFILPIIAFVFFALPYGMHYMYF
jgi:uncharacterized membrane protein YvbJ